MRYFTYEDVELGSVTKSEEEVLGEYWEYWYGRMCRKYGREHVDRVYGREECIEDWVLIHWAREVDDGVGD